VQRDDSLKAAHEAYDAGEYAKAVQLCSCRHPESRDGEIHLFLAKTYYELQQNDALSSARKKLSPSIRKNRSTTSG